MEPLLFYSTNGKAPLVGLRDALLKGQTPDRGLYLPQRYPRLTTEEIAAFARQPYPEIAFEVLRRFTVGAVDDATLHALCADAYNYDVPLEPVHGRVRVMRLDRGPTASFKDFAARLMARLIGPVCARDGPDVDDPDRHQRRHRLGRGQRVSRRRGHPRAGAVPRRRGQRPPAQADDHVAGQHPHHRRGRQIRRLPGAGETRLCRPGAGGDSAVVGQLHQHRPAAAAERLLFLRRVAAGPTGRAARDFRPVREFRRHDGRGHRRARWGCPSAGWSCR